jgi:iron complex transport system permease protein
MKKVCAFCLAIAILLVCPWIGAVDVFSSWPWSENDTAARIFFELRLPRVCLAALAGAALAASGMVFQGIFRNALACPYTLGVSTGAAFGAALAQRFAWMGLWGIGQSFFAMCGALSTVLLIALFSKRAQVSAMLLLGIVISLFFSSLIVLLQYLSDYHGLFRMIRWLMGGVETVGWASVYQTLPFVLMGLIILWVLSKPLDLISLGDDFAASKGVAVARDRMILFIAASLMTGAVVSVCGPIGFIGIMIPHFTRNSTYFGHRQQLGWNILYGAAFLALCDSIGRTIIPPFEIPVGVIMALLGAPFFLWLLLSRRIGVLS